MLQRRAEVVARLAHLAPLQGQRHQRRLRVAPDGDCRRSIAAGEGVGVGVPLREAQAAQVVAAPKGVGGGGECRQAGGGAAPVRVEKPEQVVALPVVGEDEPEMSVDPGSQRLGSAREMKAAW